MKCHNCLPTHKWNRLTVFDFYIDFHSIKVSFLKRNVDGIIVDFLHNVTVMPLDIQRSKKRCFRISDDAFLNEIAINEQ
jgi:hypothetical protein